MSLHLLINQIEPSQLKSPCSHFLFFLEISCLFFFENLLLLLPLNLFNFFLGLKHLLLYQSLQILHLITLAFLLKILQYASDNITAFSFHILHSSLPSLLFLIISLIVNGYLAISFTYSFSMSLNSVKYSRS